MNKTVIANTKGHRADVIDKGLVVTPNTAPAPVDEQPALPLARTMTVNGDGLTFDLTVDGSVDSVDAYIEASEDSDIYIKQIVILVEGEVAGSGMQLNMFGPIVGGLTNGIVPFYQNQNVFLTVSERPVFTNFDLVRLGSLTPSVGADDTAFRIRTGKTASSYGYLARWDVTQLAPGNSGFVLKADSKQKFGVRIRDDLTPLQTFEVFVLGYRRLV